MARMLTVAENALCLPDGRMARCWPGSLWRLTLTDEPARAHRGAFRMERG